MKNVKLKSFLSVENQLVLRVLFKYLFFGLFFAIFAFVFVSAFFALSLNQVVLQLFLISGAVMAVSGIGYFFLKAKLDEKNFEGFILVAITAAVYFFSGGWLPAILLLGAFVLGFVFKKKGKKKGS